MSWTMKAFKMANIMDTRDTNTRVTLAYGSYGSITFSIILKATFINSISDLSRKKRSFLFSFFQYRSQTLDLTHALKVLYY